MLDATNYQIGSFTVSTGESSFTLRCDALAFDEYHRLMLASLSGASSAVQGFSAALNASGMRPVLQPLVPGTAGKYSRFDGGYDLKKFKLAYNTWHVLAIAREPGLMPKVSETAIWQELRSERYTTPMIRAWVPYLIEQLQQSKQLVPMFRRFQCEAAVLRTSTEQLDEIVKAGVKSGALRIER